MHTGNVVVAWAFMVQDRLREEMRRLGLEQRDLAALTLVAAYEDCSQDWLRARIELTQSGTVRLIDRLAARGLLERGRSSGRGVPLRLTAAGSALLGRWSQARDQAVASVLEVLPEPVRGSMVQGMTDALRARPRLRAEADATCRACTWPACSADCPVDRSVAPVAE
jgi:DNA-binding MarR family transcriptional regulator